MTHREPATTPPSDRDIEIREVAAREAPDAAERILRLPEQLARDVVAGLDAATAAEVVSELHPEVAAEVLAELPGHTVADIVERMDPDDATDIVDELDAEQRQEVLAEMAAGSTAAVEQLLRYPAETAGGLMTPSFTALPAQQSVAQTIDELRRRHREAETIYYLYVVGDRGELTGVLSMRDLIMADPAVAVGDIAGGDVRAVSVQTDREEAARLMQRYHLLALPVVEAGGRLAGIVTVDDAIGVLEEEATEDLQRMVGGPGDERLDSPWFYSFRRRLPWLQVNLATAFLAALVVGLFDEAIAQLTALAVFLPVVAGQGGNTGAQPLAVLIRALALGEARSRAAWRILLRELVLGLAAGVVVGATCSIAAFLWTGNQQLGAVLGIAMIANMAIAGVAGAGIPLLLRRIGRDPAQASAILLTTVTDVAGFALFLGLAMRTLLAA